MNIIRPARAYFAYDAESNRSPPRRAARAKVIGWPAPKRWTGRAGLRPCLDAAITRTRSRKRYCSMSGTTPPIAATSTASLESSCAHRVRSSGWSPPWTAPTSANPASTLDISSLTCTASAPPRWARPPPAPPPQRLVHVRRGPGPGVLRLREDVEHRREVRPEEGLELDDLAVRDLDVPVDVLLEGSRVRHDRALVLEDVVDRQVLEGLPLLLRGLVKDVRVRDHDLRAALLRHVP